MAWITLVNSQSSLYGAVALEGHAKITCVSISAEHWHRVDMQQMNIKPWERKMCLKQNPA